MGVLNCLQEDEGNGEVPGKGDAMGERGKWGDSRRGGRGPVEGVIPELPGYLGVHKEIGGGDTYQNERTAGQSSGGAPQNRGNGVLILKRKTVRCRPPKCESDGVGGTGGDGSCGGTSVEEEKKGPSRPRKLLACPKRVLIVTGTMAQKKRERVWVGGSGDTAS